MTPYALEGNPHPASAGVDMCRPNVARMCNFLLGGKDHYAADRRAMAEVLEHSPGMLLQARAHRDFLVRAVEMLAGEQGIDQFVELGSGMPIRPAVHEIAGSVRPGSRVVYVDNDPVVVTHSRALVDNGDTAIAVEGDLRTPDRIVDYLRLSGAIDFRRPVGLLCGAVLHYLPDAWRAAATVRAFHDAMVAGSGLAISHLCGDFADPQEVTAIEQVYARSNAPLAIRTRSEIARLFDGFDPLPPGLAEVAGWALPDYSPRGTGIAFYGGAGTYRACG